MNISFENSFHRSLIFCNIPLAGYFRYNDIFQITNCKVELPSLTSSFQEIKPIILDYNSSYYKEYKKLRQDIDIEQESFLHFDYRKELLSILTLLSNANFFIDKAYRVTRDELGREYSDNGFYDVRHMSPMNRSNNYIEQSYNLLGDSIVLPNRTEEYFDRYFNLEGERLHRYRMSVALYYNSIDIRTISPSMGYVSLISAVENLVDYEGKINNFKPFKCEKCKRPQYELNRRFKKFMKEYCPVRSDKYNRILNDLYGRRSKVVHAGQLLYNDYANTEIDLEGNNEYDNLKNLVRIALINWLLKKRS